MKFYLRLINPIHIQHNRIIVDNIRHDGHWRLKTFGKFFYPISNIGIQVFNEYIASSKKIRSAAKPLCQCFCESTIVSFTFFQWWLFWS
jgi:hypothetical protein